MTPGDLAAKNSAFYDALWSNSYLTRPERFNTWPLVASLLPGSAMRLEVGPGLRPRLPIKNTHFIDASPPAIERLRARGGIAQFGEITALPFDQDTFDLVAAFDVIEHVENDGQVFAELTRVLKENGRLVFSVPLHAAYWTVFDDYVGHARRYEPEALQQLMAANNLVVEKSAVFGMQPNNPRMLKYTVKMLTEHRAMATRWYNWLLLPLGMLFQKRLKFTEGLMDLSNVYEVLLVCRRKP
ncbi:MAG: class I SAM-dependent methyltransferase [Verrucomicrobia bacterium]|nr:class I SAM-dependent methyltransferase [Verrucomicrobiota bacterium]